MYARELVGLCEEKLSWNRSTTYTVLRKFCQRGIFKNENGMVSSNLSREEFYAAQSEQFVEETFDGSLPAFIAAFTQRKGISQNVLMVQPPEIHEAPVFNPVENPNLPNIPPITANTCMDQVQGKMMFAAL